MGLYSGPDGRSGARQNGHSTTEVECSQRLILFCKSLRLKPADAFSTRSLRLIDGKPVRGGRIGVPGGLTFDGERGITMTRQHIALTIGGSILFAGTTHAAFTGVTTEVKDSDFGNLVANIYVSFDSPTDQLVAVAGTPNHPMSINTNGGGPFYQNAFGSDLAPNPALIPVFPSLAEDTFVTIGKKTSIGDQTGLTPGWPGFGSSSLTGTNLGWFIVPGETQGLPVDGRVLFGQFSVAFGAPVQGSALFQTIEDGEMHQYNVFWSQAHPTPGALPLLAIAGWMTRRRRN